MRHHYSPLDFDFIIDHPSDFGRRAGWMPMAVTLEVLPPGITKHSLAAELWREYDFGGRTYRIDYPKALYLKKDATTHRVLDHVGRVHCVPAPGEKGCVLRWKTKDDTHPVQF